MQPNVRRRALQLDMATWSIFNPTKSCAHPTTSLSRRKSGTEKREPYPCTTSVASSHASALFREFYTDQLEFITSLEEILSPTTAESDTKATTYVKRQQRIVKILTIVTLVTNIVSFARQTSVLTSRSSLRQILVIMKIVAAVISKSLSVISSVVDSVVDLLTSVILMWTAHKIKNRDAYKYPTGRTRLEPIAVVILSVIMCSASVQVIFESGQTLAREVEYFTDRVNRSACTTLPELDMSTVPIIAMVLTIGECTHLSSNALRAELVS